MRLSQAAQGGMMIFAVPFPAFDPVLIEIGPLVVRWYALAYIFGILGGWFYGKRLLKMAHVWKGGVPPFTADVFDDVVFWVMLGVVLGGRLGFVVFYEPSYFLSHPLEIFSVWRGGMAFHGGILGAVLALVVWARERKIPLLSLLDLAAVVAPLGLFLGRLANFVNGELWGKPTDVAWGMVFPHGGDVVRHPSQLYEAALEGVLLFAVLHLMVRRGGFKMPGLLAGVFGVGYFLARSFAEVFRAQEGEFVLFDGAVTMGMMLSLPLLGGGLFLIHRALR